MEALRVVQGNVSTLLSLTELAVPEEAILGGLYKVCAVATGHGAVNVVDLEYERLLAHNKIMTKEKEKEAEQA
jgi:hypothetical protein